MRNVSASKTFQPLSRSLALSRRPKLGHAGPPELGQWGERAEGRGNTEGIEEKPELLSPKFVLKREVSSGGKLLRMQR